MNKLLLSAIALIGIASCKKQEGVTDKQLQLKYQVDCSRCLVNVTTEYDRDQQFVVSGEWVYESQVKDLDSAKIRIQTPSAVGIMDVHYSISVNKITLKEGKGKFDPNDQIFTIGLANYK